MMDNNLYQITIDIEYSKDDDIRKMEESILEKEKKLVWSIILLKEKLLKEHPEDEEIIETAYVKTLFSVNRKLKSETEIFNAIIKEIKESFLRCYQCKKVFSVPFPYKYIISIYPFLEQQVEDWSQYLSKLISIMEINGIPSVLDYYEGVTYRDDDREFWEKNKKYFPTRNYRTNTELFISDRFRSKNNRSERPIRSISEVTKTIHLTLEAYLKIINPFVTDKLFFMKENNISNDLELIEFTYKYNLSDEVLSFTPLWKKTKIHTEMLGNIDIDDSTKNDNTNINEASFKAEKNVEYALSWLGGDYSIIEKRSINKFTGNPCIYLKNDDFRDERQEFDSIVVGPNGIFVIETKNMGGRIEIDKNGNWKQVKYGEERGVKNPVQQVKQHEALLKSIVGDNVDLISIICISNDRTIIEGQENCDVPIVKSDLLCEYIKKFKSNKVIANEKVADYKKIIELYEV